MWKCFCHICTKEILENRRTIEVQMHGEKEGKREVFEACPSCFEELKEALQATITRLQETHQQETAA